MERERERKREREREREREKERGRERLPTYYDSTHLSIFSRAQLLVDKAEVVV